MKFILSLIICFFTACSKSGSDNPPTQENSPKVSIDDFTEQEGLSGSSMFNVTVRLDHTSSKQISVTYSTVDSTAKAGEDYTPVSNQTLVFQPNETSKTISIPVLGDSIEENDEIFKVVLSSPSNATIGKQTGIVTITNSGNKAVFSNTGYDAPTSYPGYNLVWSDEFNGTTLDNSAWSYETGNGGYGNNELEYYTDRPKNLTLQDGKLVIHALKEYYLGSNYTSARIKTQGKKEFQYGRIDIRAQLPKTKGIWPALWMLGSNINSVGWPSCGEMDIMELLGQDTTKVYGTLHYNTGSGHGQKGSSYISSTFTNEFHVYSLVWKQDQVNVLIDNNVYLTVNKSDIGNTYPFNAPFFFIFNIAVGGNWPGNPDNTTQFPQWMIVDYVRVYQ